MMRPVDRCVFPPNTHDKIPTGGPPSAGIQVERPRFPQAGPFPFSRSRRSALDSMGRIGVTVRP